MYRLQLSIYVLGKPNAFRPHTGYNKAEQRKTEFQWMDSGCFRDHFTELLLDLPSQPIHEVDVSLSAIALHVLEDVRFAIGI